MTWRRRTGLLCAAALLAAVLSGCDGRSMSSGFRTDGDAAVADAAAQMDDAIDDEVHDLAKALGLKMTISNPATGVCPRRDEKDGVLLNDVIWFDWLGDDHPTREAGATVVRVLEAAGWTMHGRSRDPADWTDEEAYWPRMTATLADVVMQIEIAPASVHVILQTTCVETSREFAKDYVAEPPDPIEWK